MAGKEVPRFTYSSAIIKHAKELKEYYCKIPGFQTSDAHARIYNLLVKTNATNSTFNRRAIFQSNFQRSLLKADPTTYAGIFNNCATNTECVLIEGERCVGKTQLLQELFQQWDGIPALRRYQLTIMLDLKDKRTQDIGSLQDLLTHHTFCTCMHHDLIQEVSTAKGKDVLIIMDGFEKLPHVITKNHNSFVVKIIEGKMLPKSTKLITATPSVARTIIGQYNITSLQHIQLLGFHTEHIEIYTQFMSHLTFQQKINMYLPLNASIITRFYHKCIGNQQTLTQYYKLYCFDLIQDYIKDNNIDSNTAKHASELFQDLHPHVQRKLLLLSKIALVEMISKDTDHNLFTNGDFVHLGLMFKLQSPKDEEMQLRFLNHMLQAFLAAYYISQQEECEQDQIFFNHSLNEMNDVWRFVSGLSGLTPTIVEVVKSSVNDVHHLPFIVSLLYEQQEENVVKSVFGKEIIAYSLSYPEDSQDLMYQCYCLGYCIAASNCDWNLKFSSCNLKSDDLKALLCGLNSLPTISGSINSLQLDGNSLDYDKLLVLSQLPTSTILHQIKILNINSCHLTPECFDYLATNFIPLTPHLQVLDIGNNNTPGHSTMSKVLLSLKDLPELQELNIENTAIDFADMVPLNELLSIVGSTLTQLSIGGKDMVLESMILLIDTILTHSSIETLHISDLDMTKIGEDTITLLETNSNLTRLIFFECQLDLSHLATSLCMNTTLKVLEIFFPLSDTECDIGSQSTVALCDMLDVNRSLNELSLYSYKPLSERRVTNLIETLIYNRTLEVLQLPHHYSMHFSTSELNVIDSRVYWRVWPCLANS